MPLNVEKAVKVLSEKTGSVDKIIRQKMTRNYIVHDFLQIPFLAQHPCFI